MEWQTVSRRDPYDQVWNEPVTRLAKKYGLSDVGLAKILKKHDIPRPSRGHWAKLQFGHSPPRTPLPNPKDNSSNTMRDQFAQSEPVRPTELQEELANWQGDAGVAPVAATLRGTHRLVSDARDAFEKAEKDEIGILQGPAGSKLDLVVSKGTLRRSLLGNRCSDTLSHLNHSSAGVLRLVGNRCSDTLCASRETVRCRLRLVGNR